jgi:hypothetical protein
MHVKPITAQEKFNFPRANAILARAQALLWVRDWAGISPNIFPPPDSSGEMPAEEANRDLSKIIFFKLLKFYFLSLFANIFAKNTSTRHLFTSTKCRGLTRMLKSLIDFELSPQRKRAWQGLNSKRA